MNFAIYYTNDFRHFEEVDEVIFDFDKYDIVSLIPKKLKRQEQKGIISLLETEKEIDEIIPILNKIKQEHENIKVIIDFLEQQDWIPTLQENEIDFIFNHYPRNMSMLAAMVEYGASEIYMAEDLCFNLQKLQRFRSKGIKFRIWPDIAQTPAGTKKALKPLSPFFVRPEDVHLYEKLVDTMEFIRLGTRVNVIFEVYQKGQWLGNLEDIILDLDVNIDNTTIVPIFGTYRIRCNKRCTWSECDVCDHTQEIAEGFRKNDMGIVYKKNPVVIPESIENMLKTKGEENESISNEESLLNESISSAGDADRVTKRV